MLASPVNANGDTGAPMLDRNNIINVREGESLYQICIKLRRRLAEVPDFQQYLEEMEQREEEGSDPVSSLWQCFRTGLPLLSIYNASQPEEGELKVKQSQVPEKIGKEATYLFTKACNQKMNIPTNEIFTITDLFSDNTTGFVKVTKVVNRVLDILRLTGKLRDSTSSDGSNGIVPSATPPTERKKLTRREHILKELVDSERHYVHHLQNLQTMKKELEEAGPVTGDAIHNIFLNLNNLLDFAQRFLIRIEQQHELPEADQNWGQLFIKYKEPFRQYEPFIANQKRCEITCAKEWNNMVASARSPLMKQMLENPTILNGFLIKPFQRLTKYPLLLKDLEKQTQSAEHSKDINIAVGIIQDVLNAADASIDKEAKDDAVLDLEERIDDWKNLNTHSIGDLLLLGVFPVEKGGYGREDTEYHIYLFQRILVMCKELNPAKAKKKGILQPLSIRGKPKFSIKGRIFFANVTNINMSVTPPNYSLAIRWSGDKDSVGPDQFVIRFRSEELMKKWSEIIHVQRSACLFEKGSFTNTSSTQLTSLAGMDLVNPYAGQEDDDDYNRLSSTTYGESDGPMSRNASSNSLRQRSMTNSSAASSNPHHSQGRMRAPTDGGLRLNTTQSPSYYPSESYFSPVDRDTPPQSAITSSARSSAQSAFAGYRNITPVNSQEQNYRNTAPAMGRDNPRGNPYLPNGRHPQRPSLPPGSVHSANNASMNRMRSASSPDIHPQVQQNRKHGDNIPAVPSIPSYVSKQMHPPSRSQNNSPNNPPHRPSQTSQSAIRPQMGNHGYTYDPSYSTSRMGHTTQLSHDRTSSPPISNGDGSMPSQLKAKISFEGNYVSMIISTDITFRTLTDRIDAKISRVTSYSVANGTVKLRYRDQDGDYVLIDSDEAVSEALLDWKETHAENLGTNGLNAEIALFAHVTSDHGG